MPAFNTKTWCDKCHPQSHQPSWQKVTGFFRKLFGTQPSHPQGLVLFQVSWEKLLVAVSSGTRPMRHLKPSGAVSGGHVGLTSAFWLEKVNPCRGLWLFCSVAEAQVWGARLLVLDECKKLWWRPSKWHLWHQVSPQGVCLGQVCPSQLNFPGVPPWGTTEKWPLYHQVSSLPPLHWQVPLFCCNVSS